MFAKGKDDDKAGNAEIAQIIPNLKTVENELPPQAKTYLQQAMVTLHAPDAAAVMAGSAVDSMLKSKGYETGSMKIPANAEWLVISGQVGVNAKGAVAAGAKRQAEQAYRNVVACLRANKMTKEHLVKLTIYLTDSRYVEDVRAARLKVFGDVVQPTSTLVVIDALAAPEYLVEVEAWAAKS